jgi:hypothetical protein
MKMHDSHHCPLAHGGPKTSTIAHGRPSVRNLKLTEAT